MSESPLGDVESRLKKLVQDSSIYSITVSLTSFLGLITLLIFTRAFSPESFGRYSSSAAVVAMVSTFLFGWTEQIAVRFAPDMDKREVIQNLHSILIVLCTGFLIFAGIGYVLFQDQLGPFQVFYLPVVILIVAQGLFQPFLMYFRGLLKSKSVARFQLISAILRFSLALFLALYVLDHIVGWMWGTAIATSTAVVLIVLTTDEVQFRPRIQKHVSRRMIAYGVPMIGFIIGEPFLTQLDRILLELLQGSAAVGIYSSNYVLVNQGLRLAYFPVLRAMQPIVVSEWDGDNEDDVKEIISDFTRYYLLLGVPVMVLGAALSRPMSMLLLNSAYSEGFVIIPLVAGGVFLWGLADAGQRGLELKEATLTMSIGVILAIAFNILLNVPLILTFGYMGAALATLLSSGLYVVYIRFVSSRHITWVVPRRTLRNSFIGGLAMSIPPAIVYLPADFSFPWAITASVLAVPIYLFILYALDEFKQEELRIVVDTVRKHLA